MKVGFVGLGKMGLPLAVTMAMKGHDVIGYDIDPKCMNKEPKGYLEAGPDGGKENGQFNDWLKGSSIRFGTLGRTVYHADLVFVAVQTPHDPMYEGITVLPNDRVDFDYSYLKSSIRQIEKVVSHPIILIVMSTVLPGTMRREIMPIIERSEHITLVYNPSFIAMGTTMRDFLFPEFVLIGTDDDVAAQKMKEFYSTVCSAPVKMMAIESAELTKVAYNTYISLKIAFVNTVMEICDRFPNADCDDVTDALKAANRRLISPAYMSGGMGDGGGCHPRDNIAMSWLARTQKLSYDIFESAMLCREKQAKWLAEILYKTGYKKMLPVVILGIAFKPETNLIIGSPAYLVGNILSNLGTKAMIPTYADNSVGTKVTEEMVMRKPAVFLIGCKHERYAKFKFPCGSVVLDPHRYIREQSEGVEIRRLGSGLKIGGNKV